MGPGTEISLAFIISIISIVCVLINTTGGEKKRQKDNAELEHQRQIEIEKNFVKLNVKLDDFADTSRKLMQESNEKTAQLKKVSEHLVLISEQVKTLFKYKDDHESRIKELEGKSHKGGV